ncbi:MAG: NACHT domain-containing protein [Spirulinaceae cyanobacterium]
MAKLKFSVLERLLVRWTPVTGASAFMFHAASNADQTQALISAVGTVLAALWAAYSEGIMTDAEKRLNQLGQEHSQKFFALVEVLVLKVQEPLIRLKWWLMDDFQGQYYNRQDVTCHFLQTGGIPLDRKLRLQKMFVPVRLSIEDASQFCTNRLLEPESLESSAREQRLEQELRTPKEFGHYLKLMCENTRFNRLVILGAPGSGKTTLMRHVTLMYALRQPHELHHNAPRLLPVLLPLRNIYEEILTKPKITLPELITQHINNLDLKKPLTVPQGWFAEQLRRNRCLILLDGFDEVAEASQRQEVSRWVDQQMATWSKMPFILTSRPKGYQEARPNNGDATTQGTTLRSRTNPAICP